MLDVTDSIVVVAISDATDDRSDGVCCTLEDGTADVKSPSGAEVADVKTPSGAEAADETV